MYYRVYGLEYNDKINYNIYDLNKYLYKSNSIHWRIEQKQKNVLKGNPLLNYITFILSNPKIAIKEPPLILFIIFF